MKKTTLILFYPFLLIMVCCCFPVLSFAQGNIVTIYKNKDCYQDKSCENLATAPVTWFSLGRTVKNQSIYSLPDGEGGRIVEHQVVGSFGGKPIARSEDGILRLFSFEGKECELKDKYGQYTIYKGKTFTDMTGGEYENRGKYKNRIVASDHCDGDRGRKNWLNRILQIVLETNVEQSDLDDYDGAAFILFLTDPENIAGVDYSHGHQTVWKFPFSYKANYSCNISGNTDIVIDLSQGERCELRDDQGKNKITDIMGIDVISPHSFNVKNDYLKVVLYKHDYSNPHGRGLYNPKLEKRDFLGPNTLYVWRTPAFDKGIDQVEGPYTIGSEKYFAAWGMGGQVGVHDGKLHYFIPLIYGDEPMMAKGYYGMQWGYDVYTDTYSIPINDMAAGNGVNTFFKKGGGHARGGAYGHKTNWVHENKTKFDVTGRVGNYRKFYNDFYLNRPINNFAQNSRIQTKIDEDGIHWYTHNDIYAEVGKRHCAGGQPCNDEKSIHGFYDYDSIERGFAPGNPKLVKATGKVLSEINDDLKDQYNEVGTGTSPRTAEEAVKQHVKMDGLIWGLPLFLVEQGWGDRENQALEGANYPSMSFVSKYSHKKAHTDKKTILNSQEVSLSAKAGFDVLVAKVETEVSADWSREYQKTNAITHENIKSQSIEHVATGQSKYLKEGEFGFNGTAYFYTGPLTMTNLAYIVSQNDKPITDLEGNNTLMLTGTSGLLTKGDTDTGEYFLPAVDSVLFQLKDPGKKSSGKHEASALTKGLISAPSFALYPLPKDDYKDEEKTYTDDELQEAMKLAVDKYFKSNYNQVANKMLIWADQGHYKYSGNGMNWRLKAIYRVSEDYKFGAAETKYDEKEMSESEINTVGAGLKVGAEIAGSGGEVSVQAKWGFGWSHTTMEQIVKESGKDCGIPSSKYRYGDWQFHYYQVFIKIRDLKTWLSENKDDKDLNIYTSEEEIIYQPVNQHTGLLNKPPFIPDWSWNTNQDLWIMFPVIPKKVVNMM